MKPLTRRPPEWTDAAPVHISATRELAASPDEVFAALADHESWPRWFAAVSKVERFGEPTEGLGSRRRVFLGRRFRVEEEFIEWEPGRTWGFTVTGASMGGARWVRSVNERVTIEALDDDTTRVTYLQAIEPAGWLSPLLRLARGSTAKRLGTALESLGEHIAAGRE